MLVQSGVAGLSTRLPVAPCAVRWLELRLLCALGSSPVAHWLLASGSSAQPEGLVVPQHHPGPAAPPHPVAGPVAHPSPGPWLGSVAGSQGLCPHHTSPSMSGGTGRSGGSLQRPAAC